MAERNELMGNVFGQQSRQALAHMLSTHEEEHKDVKVQCSSYVTHNDYTH